ncbi:TPA: hypothetical protein PCF53_002259 [Klebsiella quasipneumoniae]|nr:hypothetical protein [Klebsiella quasipneumoniae]
MTSLWDDFRVFGLRREDLAYESPCQKWIDISRRYFFVGFKPIKSDELPRKNDKASPRFIMFDLLDKLYRSQATSDGREFRRPNLKLRDSQPIRSERIDEEWIDVLGKGIFEKEKALSYLCESYRNVVKKHRKVEMLTMTFHLPPEASEAQSAQNFRNETDDSRFRLQLAVLERRFTLLRKRINADPLYKAACGYSRMILINAKFEPYYLVNFFFKKHPVSPIDSLVPINIYKKWIRAVGDEPRINSRVKYYCLYGASRPYVTDDSWLLVRKPERMTDVGQFSDPVSLVVLEDKKFDNNRKGYLALFRLQAQIYNVIPRARTLTCSDDLTYINLAEKKRRKVKKIGAKNNIKMALPEVVSSDSSDHYDTDSEATVQLEYQDSRCEGFLPTNLEEHFEYVVKK